MRKELFIRLLNDMPETMADDGGSTALRASWVLREDNRLDSHVFHGDLKDAAAQASGARVTVLVPSADVLLAQVVLPNLKGQKLAKAAPFAMEDQLAEDVDDLHVAQGQRDAVGRLANAVVSREVLETWLGQLKEAGLHPDVVSPEVFGVSWPMEAETDQSWSLIIDQSRAILRTGAQLGLAFETDNIVVVLRAALESAGEALPKQLLITTCEDTPFDTTELQRKLAELCELRGVNLVTHQTDTDCSAMLAAGFNEQTAINLLQGDYSRKGQLEKMFRPWRTAVVLVIVWLLFQASLLGIEYVRLANQQSALNAEMTALFQEAFPDKRLVSGQERVLMERGLAELHSGGGGNDGFLDLLARTGSVLKDEQGIRLRSIRFKDNKLDVDIDLPDLQVLDSLKQQFTDKAGLAVEIVSASSRDGKVESRLSLQSSEGGAQ